jgi:hypothetical protein
VLVSSACVPTKQEEGNPCRSVDMMLRCFDFHHEPELQGLVKKLVIIAMITVKNIQLSVVENQMYSISTLIRQGECFRIRNDFKKVSFTSAFCVFSFELN